MPERVIDLPLKLSMTPSFGTHAIVMENTEAPSTGSSRFVTVPVYMGSFSNSTLWYFIVRFVHWKLRAAALHDHIRRVGYSPSDSLRDMPHQVSLYKSHTTSDMCVCLFFNHNILHSWRVTSRIALGKRLRWENMGVERNRLTILSTNMPQTTSFGALTISEWAACGIIYAEFEPQY